MSYAGRTAPWQIIRQVKPKLTKLIKKYSAGTEDQQVRNELWDGENLSAMVTLYKYRGQVDLVLTDPPYNTGEDFRYNDKWDTDPNDPALGELVLPDDGSRHSKWLRFMTPRLWMMREMLKSTGVIAICIDHRELFRLGGGAGFNYRCRCLMLSSILFWAVTNSVAVAGSVRLFVDSPPGALQQKRKCAHCQPRILARDRSGTGVGTVARGVRARADRQSFFVDIIPRFWSY